MFVLAFHQKNLSLASFSTKERSLCSGGKGSFTGGFLGGALS